MGLRRKIVVDIYMIKSRGSLVIIGCKVKIVMFFFFDLVDWYRFLRKIKVIVGKS